MLKTLVFLLNICFLNVKIDAASISNENQLTKMDCSYKDGRLGRIDLSRVGLKGGIPAFRHVLKDDYVYS